MNAPLRTDDTALRFGPIAGPMIDHLRKTHDGWIDIMVAAETRVENYCRAEDDLAFEFAAEEARKAETLANTLVARNEQFIRPDLVRREVPDIQPVDDGMAFDWATMPTVDRFLVAAVWIAAVVGGMALVWAVTRLVSI